MKRHSTYLVLPSVVLFSIQPGCATIIHGGDQHIGISSTPDKAHVRIDGIPYGDTPLFAELKRRKAHTVALSLEGYQPYEGIIKNRLSGWVWGNILLGGGLGLIVDLITGSVKELHPERIHADLVPIDETTTD